MANSRPSSKKTRSKSSKTTHSKPPPSSPTTLLTLATNHLQTGQPSLALPFATQALSLLSPLTATSLPALTLLGEIHLELGDASTARSYFLQAVDIDPEGLLSQDQICTESSGAEKFLWLAQLSEEGGEESVRRFEKGVEVLNREIGELEERIQQGGLKPAEKETIEGILENRRRKCAGALCGIVEVYMTDLSYHPTAESFCITHITHALLLAPSSPTPLQTLASIRLSQSDLPAARAALCNSLECWNSLPPSSPLYPDFPTRISLSRLLMEAEMEEEAMAVLEGLVDEEDGSVEGWYLGGWCLYLLAGKTEEMGGMTGKTGGIATNTNKPTTKNKIPQQQQQQAQQSKASSQAKAKAKETRAHLLGSLDWLRESLRLYQLVEYEDERLRAHAMELVEEIRGILGPVGEGEEDGEEEDEWEEDENEDENGTDKGELAKLEEEDLEMKDT